DSTYSASDVNLNIQISGLTSGTALTVATEQSNLNLRNLPSTDADVIGKAAKGDTVTLIEQSSDDWWKVRTSDGKEGYAYARYLRVCQQPVLHPNTLLNLMSEGFLFGTIFLLSSSLKIKK